MHNAWQIYFHTTTIWLFSNEDRYIPWIIYLSQMNHPFITVDSTWKKDRVRERWWKPGVEKLSSRKSFCTWLRHKRSTQPQTHATYPSKWHTTQAKHNSTIRILVSSPKILVAISISILVKHWFWSTFGLAGSVRASSRATNLEASCRHACIMFAMVTLVQVYQWSEFKALSLSHRYIPWLMIVIDFYPPSTCHSMHSRPSPSYLLLLMMDISIIILPRWDVKCIE